MAFRTDEFLITIRKLIAMRNSILNMDAILKLGILESTSGQSKLTNLLEGIPYRALKVLL